MTECPYCNDDLEYAVIINKAYLGCKNCKRFWDTDLR